MNLLGVTPDRPGLPLVQGERTPVIYTGCRA
ncbi:hypothetical protein LMG9964_00592 [Paraburkholderia phenoliruptrix]|uniref:Uncharacterized protein n=1 Tax=Paraburkholderia phenoliruptrix TaxID=252970 RepID=A0A6J5JZ68_9BURK|nr:hypothetical protein [Paraburkholderia phenoliruptrix]CAB4046960.1 hypothetical protein LMG9964_00592 [Paraburkholderia phenoliruptrix]